jgi:hypothetical protein
MKDVSLTMHAQITTRENHQEASRSRDRKLQAHELVALTDGSDDRPHRLDLGAPDFVNAIDCAVCRSLDAMPQQCASLLPSPTFTGTRQQISRLFWSLRSALCSILRLAASYRKSRLGTTGWVVLSMATASPLASLHYAEVCGVQLGPLAVFHHEWQIGYASVELSNKVSH